MGLLARNAACAFLLLAGFVARAQVPTQDLEQELESIADGNEENEVDLIQLAEQLELLRQNPVKVNFASADDLEQIPYLNIFQIANLLSYRRSTGPLYSEFELAVIKGFDRQTIEQVRPFLDFSTEKALPELKARNILRYSKHNLLARTNFNLQPRRGFLPGTENGFLGERQNYYLRYRGLYRDNLSIGLTAQQDPGEPFGAPYQDAGVDFLSGHAALLNYGPVKSLVVGDYQVELGQGLALWSSLAFGKGAEATDIKRFPRGVRPFTGAEENRFFRGVAGTFAWRDWELTTFYSNRAIDANISASDSFGSPVLSSSLQTTGLHRTENELADKDANRLVTYGGSLSWHSGRLKTAINNVNYQLALPLEPGSQPYQFLRFSGDQLSNYSFDFNYIYRDLNLFGEAALSDNGATALSIGVQARPADGFQASILARRFEPDYQFIYNAPFAENGNYGERGLYFGIEWQMARWLVLKSFFDVYQFQWLRFGADRPSEGREALAQFDFPFSRRFSAYLRYRFETREVNPPADEINEPLVPLVEEDRHGARFHVQYDLSNQWRLASRLELSFYEEQGRSETGSVIFQDIRYYFQKLPLNLTARLALINTESFDTRIYAYENDLTYAFSIPPYYGRSVRFYVLGDLDITERLVFQIKYGITEFYDREEISSGLNAIDGNIISELRMQLRWRF